MEPNIKVSSHYFLYSYGSSFSETITTGGNMEKENKKSNSVNFCNLQRVSKSKNGKYIIFWLTNEICFSVHVNYLTAIINASDKEVS